VNLADLRAHGLPRPGEERPGYPWGAALLRDDRLAAHFAAEAERARRPLGHRPHAYVEAHIEQGPLLEAERLDIGVVTGIQGSRWFTVTLTGAAAHAGTFVPCRDGVSHNPAEYAESGWLAAGARVLTRTLLHLGGP